MYVGVVLGTTEKIIQLVEENPGIRYSEIRRATGLANGVLSYHLSKIEKSGQIMVERTPRVARLYPCGIRQEEAVVIKHLKNPTERKILSALLEGEQDFKEIVKKTKKSQGTISFYLKTLCGDNLIRRKIINKTMMFQLVDVALMSSIIGTQPMFIENTANNIADIFSSL